MERHILDLLTFLVQVQQAWKKEHNDMMEFYEIIFPSSIRRTPVKGVADTRLHSGDFLICELLKLGLALAFR